MHAAVEHDGRLDDPVADTGHGWRADIPALTPASDTERTAMEAPDCSPSPADRLRGGTSGAGPRPGEWPTTPQASRPADRSAAR